MTAPSQQTGPVRPMFLQRRFLPMWTAFVLGVFADNTLRQALIIGVGFGYIAIAGFESGANAIPVVGSLFAVAMLIFSSISGQIAEKYDTAFLLRRIKLVELCLMGLAAIGFLTGNGWLLIAVLFGMGVQSAFFSPVRIGAMPKYLHKDELVRGNAIFNAGLYVAILSGLFLGGLLIERPAAASLLSALLVGASAFGWLAVRAAPPAPADAPDLTVDWNVPRQGYRILSYAVSAPGVLWPLMGAAAFFYTTTLVTVLVPIYIRDVWSAGGAVASIIMGLFAIGAGLGALSAALLARNRSGLGASAFGIGVASVLTTFSFALGLAAPPPADELRSVAEFFALPRSGLLAVAFCLTSAALGFYMVPLQAAAQRRAPPARRSRIMAAGNMMNAAAAMTGSLSVLIVTHANLSPNLAILLVAMLQAVISVVMAIRWRKLPSGAFDAPFEET